MDATPDNSIPQAASVLIMGIPALAHSMLADVTTQSPEWVGSITQISAFGLVAWIVYYMFTKWLPAIQSAHAEQMKEQRDAQSAATRIIADAHANAVSAMTTAFSESLKSQRADLLQLIQQHEK